MIFDTTKEATLAGSGKTYYQSIPWQTVAIHGLLEKLTTYVCIYCMYIQYIGICSIMGPPTVHSTYRHIHTQPKLLFAVHAVYCTKDTVPSVGHGSLTVVAA